MGATRKINVRKIEGILLKNNSMCYDQVDPVELACSPFFGLHPTDVTSRARVGSGLWETAGEVDSS